MLDTISIAYIRDDLAICCSQADELEEVPVCAKSASIIVLGLPLTIRPVPSVHHRQILPLKGWSSYGPPTQHGNALMYYLK